MLHFSEPLGECVHSSTERSPPAHAFIITLSALHRYKTLQQENRVDKQTIRDLIEEYDRKIRTRDQDIQTSRAIEEHLLEEIHNMEDKWRV